jgi:hypothetical protein
MQETGANDFAPFFRLRLPQCSNAVGSLAAFYIQSRQRKTEKMKT